MTPPTYPFFLFSPAQLSAKSDSSLILYLLQSSFAVIIVYNRSTSQAMHAAHAFNLSLSCDGVIKPYQRTSWLHSGPGGPPAGFPNQRPLTGLWPLFDKRPSDQGRFVGRHPGTQSATKELSYGDGNRYSAGTASGLETCRRTGLSRHGAGFGDFGDFCRLVGSIGLYCTGREASIEPARSQHEARMKRRGAGRTFLFVGSGSSRV